MAKKFGKVLLLTAAAASAAVAVCCFLKKKEDARNDEEDYDDFSDDRENDSENLRSYVPLNQETEEGNDTDASSEQASAAQDAPEEAAQETSGQDDTFTPLTKQVSDAAESSVEEYISEENPSDAAAPVDQN